MGCQHEGCRCDETRVEREGKRFCSERCAEIEASGRPADSPPHCICGHADCAAA